MFKTHTHTIYSIQAPQYRLVKLWASVKIKRWFRVLRGALCSTRECEKSCTPHSVLAHMALFKLLSCEPKAAMLYFQPALKIMCCTCLFLNTMHESLNVWKAAHVSFLLRLTVKQWRVYTRSANKIWHRIFFCFFVAPFLCFPLIRK